MTTELTSADVPQEDNLHNVRLVAQAIADGLEDTQSIADRAKISRRHVGYAINACFVLGWVAETPEKLAASDAARALFKTTPGSAEEKALLRASIEGSAAIHAIAPALLAAGEPDRPAIVERIAAATGLSKSTSDRRAQTLLSWRRQVLAPPAAPAAASAATAATLAGPGSEPSKP